MKNLSIVAVGAGNVAHQLVPHFKRQGYEIAQVYSRTLKHAKQLAKKVNAKATNSIEQILPDADIYYFMLSDDAIVKLAKALKGQIASSAVILHSSGSKSSKLLKGTTKHYGVVYPLQTFSKTAKVDLSQIPVFTTGNSKHARDIAKKLASTISKKTYSLSDQKRKELHLAAVVCNNFVHHLFVKSSEYLKSKHIPFAYLQPLIEDTMKNAGKTDLRKKQTGPAKRNDKKTINTHLEMLKQDPEFKKLYAALSKSIKETHA